MTEDPVANMPDPDGRLVDLMKILPERWALAASEDEPAVAAAFMRATCGRGYLDGLERLETGGRR